MTQEENIALRLKEDVRIEKEMTFSLYRMRTVISGKFLGKIGLMINHAETLCLFTMENMYKIIPVGQYSVSYTRSPKFSGLNPYKKIADGRVPLLNGVEGRSGIRIHVGNFPGDSQGCIMVGAEMDRNVILQSQHAYKLLMNHVEKHDFTSMRLNIYDIDSLFYYTEDKKVKIEDLMKEIKKK